MKICLFLQRRFAYVGHALACNVKEEFPNAEFCGLVQTRQSMEFLQNQQDLHYTSLLLEEETHEKLHDESIDYEYLKKIEDEYGIPNLWPYLYVDRIIMHGQLRREYPHDQPLLSHEEMLKKIQVSAKAVIAFLDREKPDVIFWSAIGSVTSLLTWHIAKKRGIPTIISIGARMNNRMAWSDDFHTLSWVRKRFLELEKGAVSPKREEAKKFLEEFRTKPFTYNPNFTPHHNYQAYRRGNLLFLEPKKLVWGISWYVKSIAKQLFQKRDYSDVRAWEQAWDKLRRKARGLVGYDRFYSVREAGKRYAFFPLQQEPETSILLYTPYHTNQLDFIKAAAHALPIDMMLYVKEHPEMVGWRKPAYYEAIVKIPNVRLLDPRQQSFDIVKNAELTYTITGTAGWESILFGKPVITFGYAYFNDIPGVIQCENFNELPYLTKKQLENFTHNEKTVLNYVSALMEDSVPVNYSKFWDTGASIETMRADSGMRAYSKLLAQKIKEVTASSKP